jgi:hypothetical protein
MTDDNVTDDNVTTADEPDPQQTDTADDPGTESTEPDADAQQGAEAARYRRRLRQTETERDDLARRVEALQRQQIEALLAQEHVTPQALWATTQLADLVGDDGLVDPELVSAAASAAREELGITEQPKRTGMAGLHSGTMRPPPSIDRWVDAFTPAKE